MSFLSELKPEQVIQYENVRKIQIINTQILLRKRKALSTIRLVDAISPVIPASGRKQLKLLNMLSDQKARSYRYLEKIDRLQKYFEFQEEILFKALMGEQYDAYQNWRKQSKG